MRTIPAEIATTLPHSGLTLTPDCFCYLQVWYLHCLLVDCHLVHWCMSQPTVYLVVLLVLDYQYKHSKLLVIQTLTTT
jgi:hypothetical protein